MSDRYAVVGNPVAHSLSPRIHAEFARATGQDMTYETLLAPLDGFAATVEAFFAAGGAGLNVTIPFKEEAARWVDDMNKAARAAGAVNTIVRTGAGFAGCNTDGAGLIRDLTATCGLSLGGSRVLLLGAGGAARGVVGPLLAQGPAALTIANRTEARAADLADVARGQTAADTEVSGVGLGGVARGYDLVINATSAGLGAAAHPIDINPAAVAGAFCYDMVYAGGGRSDTAFCRWAAASGARAVADGLGMLVEQAALAFELWRGVVPPAAAVLERLRRGGV